MSPGAGAAAPARTPTKRYAQDGLLPLNHARPPKTPQNAEDGARSNTAADDQNLKSPADDATNEPSVRDIVRANAERAGGAAARGNAGECAKGGGELEPDAGGTARAGDGVLGDAPTRGDRH